VLVLGCTHYPLIKPVLRRVAPEHVTIVDSAESTAHVVCRKLKVEPLNTPDAPERRQHPRIRFFATDSVEKFKRLGPQFLGHAFENVEHVDLKE